MIHLFLSPYGLVSLQASCSTPTPHLGLGPAVSSGLCPGLLQALASLWVAVLSIPAGAHSPPDLLQFFPHHSPAPHAFLPQGHCPAGHPSMYPTHPPPPFCQFYLTSSKEPCWMTLTQPDVRKQTSEISWVNILQMGKLSSEMTGTGPASPSETGRAGTRLGLLPEPALALAFGLPPLVCLSSCSVPRLMAPCAHFLLSQFS